MNRLLTRLNICVVVLHPCRSVNMDNYRNGLMMLTTPMIIIAIFHICMDCFLPIKFLPTVHHSCTALQKIHSFSVVMYLPGGVWRGKSTGGPKYSMAIMPISLYLSLIH